MAKAVRIRSGKQGTIGRRLGQRKNRRPAQRLTRPVIRHPERSTIVTGVPGVGKSTLLLNLVLDDIRQADKGIVVLDPHAELVEDILLRCPPEHADRVVLFDPEQQAEKPFGLNVFEWHEEREKNRRIEAALMTYKHTWYDSFQSTPVMQATLNTLVRTLVEAYPKYQTHFYHLQMLLQDNAIGDAWRERLSACVSHLPPLATRWQRWEKSGARNEDTRTSRDKIFHIISNPIIQNLLCQPTTSKCFRFQEVLSAKKVLLMNLKGLGGPDGIKLIGSLILTQLLAMAHLRREEDKQPVHIYADEFYYFPGQAFVELIDQVRKYKVFCTIAHQHLSQLKDNETRHAATNCGNMIVFKVNPADEQVLAKHFERDSFSLSELDDYQAMAKVKWGTAERQGLITTHPPQGEINEEVAEQIRQQSLAYGRPGAEVENGIGKLSQVLSQQPQDDLVETVYED